MDIELNFVEQGQGSPLILLHGNGEDASCFEHQMEPFSRHFRVLAVETRGHGKSPRGSAPFTIEQFALDLKEFLDGQGISRCSLCGFSDGGNIALAFACRWPERLERLVLAGANLFPAGLLPRYQKPFEERWQQLHWRHMNGELSEEEIREWELLDLMVTQPQTDLSDLPRITCPVLVTAGDRDMVDLDHTLFIARSIPGCRLCILPGSHFIHRKSWETWNRTVLDFLTGRSDSRRREEADACPSTD